jgi:hypothetical protein
MAPMATNSTVKRLMAVEADTAIQVWSRLYGSGLTTANDQANGLAVDPRDGSVYVTGSSYSTTSGFDILTIKYDASGDSLWAARFNSPSNGDDFALGVALDPSGDVIVVGSGTTVDTTDDFVTIKYNAAGAVQWTKYYNGPIIGDDDPAAFAIDDSGNIYVTGSSVGTDTLDEYATIKYSSSGDSIWIARYSSLKDYNSDPIAIELDQSGNIYVTGTRSDSNGVSNYLTIKYNSAGTSQWSELYDNTANSENEAVAMTIDKNGMVYVTGYKYSDETGYDYATVEYSSGGVQQKVLVYNDPEDGDDEAADVLVDNSGNLFVTGSSQDANGDYQITTIKYASSGARKWVARYGVPFTDAIAEFIAMDSLGYIYAAGNSVGSDGSCDFTAIKYNQQGGTVWLSNFETQPNAYATLYQFYLDSVGTGYFTGTSSENGTDYFSTVKFYQPPFMTASKPVATLPAASIGCMTSDTIYLTNSGSVPLHISSSSSTVPEFSDDFTDSTIAPMDSAQIVFSFAPITPGVVNGAISFTSDALNSPFTDSLSGIGLGAGPGLLVSVTLGKNWQLISLPVQVTCPAVIPGLFEYSSGYVGVDTLYNGTGYWKKLTNPNLSFSGYEISGETLQVKAQWNIIGSISSPVATGNFATNPESLITSFVYGYSASGYFVTDSVYPAHGYWVKAKQPGAIILSNRSVSTPKTSSTNIFGGYNRLKIRDARGREQTLYFTGATDGNVLSGMFEMPPKPPEGVFDIRFANNQLVALINGGGGNALDVEVSSVVYPLTTEWDVKQAGKSFALRTGGSEILLTGQGNAQVSDATERIVLETGSVANISKEYQLEQNYPNPFNPTTKLRFSIPDAEHVSLKIFDLTGKEILTLLDERRDAGRYEVEWNAANVASGIYFYKLTAGAYTATRKMAVVK